MWLSVFEPGAGTLLGVFASRSKNWNGDSRRFDHLLFLMPCSLKNRLLKISFMSCLIGSRVDWLHEGDMNTGFFHARAAARCCANRISALLQDDGSICNSQGEIKNMVQSFYDNLFTSEPCAVIDDVLASIPQKVSPDMNEELCRPYFNEEIKSALFQMGPTKAPGLDGFPALFYQTHWDFMEEDICQAVRSFLDGQPIPE